jgi:hypothetical protein
MGGILKNKATGLLFSKQLKNLKKGLIIFQTSFVCAAIPLNVAAMENAPRENVQIRSPANRFSGIAANFIYSPGKKSKMYTECCQTILMNSAIITKELCKIQGGICVMS